MCNSPLQRRGEIVDFQNKNRKITTKRFWFGTNKKMSKNTQKRRKTNKFKKETCNKLKQSCINWNFNMKMTRKNSLHRTCKSCKFVQNWGPLGTDETDCKQGNPRLTINDSSRVRTILWSPKAPSSNTNALRHDTGCSMAILDIFKQWRQSGTHLRLCWQVREVGRLEDGHSVLERVRNPSLTV